MASMTKIEFADAIADANMGLWSTSAYRAIENNQTDLFVDHWREQYEDKGSRPTVERMLGKELTAALLSIIMPNFLKPDQKLELMGGEARLITMIDMKNGAEHWSVRFLNNGEVKFQWIEVDYDPQDRIVYR
jgi:hypothetical protein